uniref:PA14 domain-containing protein n=1 Tax=Gopherus agassizii TaxID=38772 RepID=A0A452HNK4_9SAUR
MVHKDAWLISAKQEVFLYQTFSDIASVFPVSGSLGGGSDLTITGDFFDQPVQVTVAGVPCQIKHCSPRKISCITGPIAEIRRLAAPQAGNRGLLFEVWDDAAGTDLTETAPGYRWQIVPNASSPERFLSQAQQSFSSRLRGFFVAPQTNNYTFWIQADGRASLHLSLSEDPGKKVKVAFIPAGASEWSEHWEKNWSKSWQPKSQKFELMGGSKYYLEALHHGKAPSSGMRVGVQLHNTWLNPDVVNTYRRERHEIWASALRLPEIQMLTLSGTGWFRISWDNVSSNMMATNATADQVQTVIEELLSVKCETEPLSAKFLLRNGFEEGNRDPATEGHVASWTEPFCGRFSIHRPKHLIKMSPSILPRYNLTEYTHVCFAYKGYVSDTLYVSVSYINTFLNTVKKNLTCLWSLNETSPESWKFTCADLWRCCVNGSESLRDLEANSSVFVHQIDMLIPEREEETSSWFYLDEIIVSDRNIAVFQKDFKPARPGGNVIQEVSVVGSPPTYNVSFLVAGCGSNLPLLGALPSQGSEEDHLAAFMEGANVSMTVQRVQAASPPIGGTFRILLPNTVISGVPVHVSSHHLRKLLQSNSDNSTGQYFNASDFTVTKDVSTCYQDVWTLTWNSMTGDLPIVIDVSAENLTGLNPTIAARVVYDGGVFIGPIFGDMLATANNHTQVVVVVNDVPANCSGSCSFQYSQEATPLVSHVDYSLGNVYITGSGFAEDSQALQIEVNHTTCQVMTSNQTAVVCWMNMLPMGLYHVTLLVRPYGFARNASEGQGIYLRVKPRLEAIEPPTTSEIGGCSVILRGTGFDGISQVLFGSHPCPINTNASNSVRIECEVPSRGDEEYVVHVTLTAGSQSATFTEVFKYDPSLNPAIVSLSRNRSSTAGLQSLRIGISSFANCTGLDVQVKIEATVAQIQARTAHGVDVVLPALADGWYNLSVIINGIAIIPSRGSACGGLLLTISGLGLKSRRNSVHVSLTGNYTCEIRSVDHNRISCALLPREPPLGDWWLPDASHALNVTVTVNGIQSVCLSDCALHLLKEWTPRVDAVVSEINGTLSSLLIRGQRLALATDELVIQVDNHDPCNVTFWNETSIQCQTGSLSPGEHSLSVSNRRSGHACFSRDSRIFTVIPCVLKFYPQNFSTNGGGLLAIQGAALKGRNSTSILVGNRPCLITDVSYVVLRCSVPLGNGIQDLTLEIDGISYHLGEISYSEEFTPIFLFLLPPVGLLLTMTVSRITGVESMHISIGDSPCTNITGNHTTLQCSCSAPWLPAGEYRVLGGDFLRGWASSNLTFTSELTVISTRNNWGKCGLGGGEVHVHGTGFAPGNTSVTICGAPCEMLGDITTTDVSCLAPRLDASLAVLCGLTHPSEDCKGAGTTYVQCDVHITAGAYSLAGARPYIYLCDDDSLLDSKTKVNSPQALFAGLFFSPKVERDEVLIYNSSCNITMETEAEMECEGANQPITAKITEIRKNWGQNTQV